MAGGGRRWQGHGAEPQVRQPESPCDGPGSVRCVLQAGVLPGWRRSSWDQASRGNEGEVPTVAMPSKSEEGERGVRRRKSQGS